MSLIFNGFYKLLIYKEFRKLLIYLMFRKLLIFKKFRKLLIFNEMLHMSLERLDRFNTRSNYSETNIAI